MQRSAATAYDPYAPNNPTRAQIRDETYALLTGGGAIDPDTSRAVAPAESL